MNASNRVGTFDEANPYDVLASSQWLDDDDVCLVYHRQQSGGRSVAHLDSGDLDIAMLGSTPYSTAIARGAALTAVAVLHNKGAAQALVVRCGLQGPQDLRGTVIATPRYSTAHYILLAGLVESNLEHVERMELPPAGADVGSDIVTVVTTSPLTIETAWAEGRIDGAAVWGNTAAILTSTPWGGDPPSGCSREPAHEMITASMVARWGYETLNVLAVSNAFLAGGNEALVERLVTGVVRANADYRLAAGLGRWAAPGGEYNRLVSAFVTLYDDYNASATLENVARRVAMYEYPTAEEQLQEQSSGDAPITPLSAIQGFILLIRSRATWRRRSKAGGLSVLPKGPRLHPGHQQYNASAPPTRILQRLLPRGCPRFGRCFGLRRRRTSCLPPRTSPARECLHPMRAMGGRGGQRDTRAHPSVTLAAARRRGQRWRVPDG